MFSSVLFFVCDSGKFIPSLGIFKMGFATHGSHDVEVSYKNTRRENTRLGRKSAKAGDDLRNKIPVYSTGSLQLLHKEIMQKKV